MAESFEQACALEPAALRALFEHGRAEQRMWAIWVLALRADGALDPEQRIVTEPDAGVRRTLAVMLAGKGKGWLVVALAKHDPELAVRETAIQLATRLACGGKLEVALIVRLCERDPALTVAALGAIGPGAPAALIAFAEQQLARGSDIQLEAFEALVRIGGEPRERARAWMVKRKDIALLCDRWLHAADAESLAAAFASSRAELRAVALQRMNEPPWSAVELLVGDDERLIESLLHRTDIAIPARVLAIWIMEGKHDGFVERLTTQLVIAGQGRTLLADVRTALERDPDPASVRALVERSRVFAAALEIPGAVGVIDELGDHHPVEQLVGLDNALARWLVGRDAPAELLPLLPALHRHATEQLARTAHGPLREAFRLLPSPGLGPGVPASVYRDGRRFAALATAIQRVLG